ncbi:MAG: Gfo/Idh/MocA family oxidoreductase [Verrucomicrobia bacterium]|nr:Gfo/Idh/MocA family oxidoreductase [Verrucomicrobiota bacterium]
MSNTHSVSRREFLRTARNTAFGVGVGVALPNLFLNQTKAATGENPSELVRVGVIGTGLQGNGNIAAIMKNVVALCDVDKKHLEATQARVEKANGTKVATYADYRKLLEDKSVDAVLIATPDHWHALPAADAMVAGKDVYCEKPLTLTIHEGQVLMKLARKHKKILQTGSMQRSDAKFIKACEYIRNGRIGKIKRVLVGLPGVNYADTLNRGGKPLTVPDSEPPPELNYDMWLGPAPYRPYNVNRVHYLFRFFWDYSGGQMTNWGAHHLDITQWALGMDESGPVEAVASAEFNKEKLYETPTSFHITYKYASGTVVECDSGGNKEKYKMGATFEGEKGTIYVNRGALTFDPEGLEEDAIKDSEVHLYPSYKAISKLRNPHHANWLECIKTRQEPVCSLSVGHHSAVVCHLGNIAVRTGKKVQWDPVKEEIIGDAETAKWAFKVYRAPWKLPAV